MATSATRGKTGERCKVGGAYEFDGYVDGSSSPPPTQEERVIRLDLGETFPPIRSCNKAAWWLLR